VTFLRVKRSIGRAVEPAGEQQLVSQLRFLICSGEEKPFKGSAGVV